MSLMDKIKSMFSGGSSDAADAHADHDHAGHDHAGHDHAGHDRPARAGRAGDRTGGGGREPGSTEAASR